MYKNILLASDGSAHAERAAQQAIQLAHLHQGEVTILFVLNPSTSNGNERTLEQEVQYSQKKLRNTETSLKEANISFSIEVMKGDPAPEIISYANRNSYDVLIIGSRGLNSLQEMVLGSVSHKVMKHSECPVLIVK